MQANKRTTVDPMRLAWLLRADLRQGAPAGGPVSDWFKMWWMINAPREYPASIDHAALRDAGLFQPQPGWPSYGGFGMTAVLRFLLDTRPDLRNTFDVDTDEGLWHAIAWLFVHGVREHRLASALDTRTLAALDATPPFFADDDALASGRPTLTWLMFFVWRTSDDLQTHFDLRQQQDRQAYMGWFLLNGVPQLKLAPLLAPRWPAWLRELVLQNQTQAAVPRAAYLLWQRHQQLQRAFDLRTDQGIAAFAMWSAEVWSTQAELSWIDQPSTPAPQKARLRSDRPFGLNLIGFAFGELGIGEDVRMAVAACEAAGIPFAVVNIHPGDTLRQADQALAAHVAKAGEQADQAPYAFNLFCLTGFDTARVYLERGPDLFDGRYNIGWWPWELPVWPRDWLVAFDLVDEVWAATSFTHRMYTEAAALASPVPTPVTLVPMPASVTRLKPMSRDGLGLPENRYLFLYVFDFNSYLARKNPFATVKSFRKAFDIADRSVGLVLKTMNADPDNPEWKRFIRECAKDPRILLMDRTMERGEVLGLINACDAYVSLHRSEGLGRTLAEAMLFGKAVIGTNFSGNVDFLTDKTGFPVEWEPTPVLPGQYPYVTASDRAWWAAPKVSTAAKQMRRVRALAMENRLQAPDTSTLCFAPDKVGEIMRAALDQRNYSSWTA
jgi:glycosyltransferase involved in cell wall biosynthesis